MSGSSTKYTVFNQAGDELGTKSKKSAAVDMANTLADENRGETFTVRTQAGNDVHVAMRKPSGNRAAPWTRTDSSDKIELTAPKGYHISYTRVRIPAIVCAADDKSGLIVVTPEGSTEVKNTVEARLLTNQLGQEAAVKRAEAKEAEKARKAQERADAKAAKEAEAAAASDAA